MEMVRSTRGMVLAGGAAVCVLSSCGSSGEPEEAAPPPPPPAVVESADPVAAFAPLVRHHRAEDAFPIGADRFLERSTLKWKDGICIVLETVATGRIARRKTSEPVPWLDPASLAGRVAPHRRRQLDVSCRRPRGPAYDTTQLTRPYDPGRRPDGLREDSGFYVDLLTDSYDGDPRFARGGARRVVGAPVYVERRPIAAAGGRGQRLTYWMLYAHEAHIARDGERVAPHEGDWQRVDVVLRKGAGADTWRPVSVSLDADRRSVPWRSLETVAGGGSATRSHPVLFAARSSHTLYAAPGRRSAELDTEGGKVRVRDDASSCATCVRWRTWDDLLPVRAQPWYGFGGGWGFVYRADEESGPLGPMPGRP